VAGLRRLLPPSLSAPPLDTLLVRFGPGTGGPAGLNAPRRGPPGWAPSWSRAHHPADVVNFGRVQSLPLLLGMALSLLALVTIRAPAAHLGPAAAPDFAVLRSIGLTRRQVRSAISWR
jgi:hypothetical protein